MKIVLICFGSLFTGLGVLGIFLPLLPTTPFLLLAAACYARSSEKCHNWLMNHKWFGPYLNSFKPGQGMPMRAKVTTLVVLWWTLLVSAYFTRERTWLWIILGSVGIGVTIFISCLKTAKNSENLTNVSQKS